MKNIEQIPTTDEAITKLYNIVLYVISFENYIISSLAILLVFLGTLHIYLLFTSDKYNEKRTKQNSNAFFIWPSKSRIKLGLLGVLLFIIIGVIFIEE